MTFYDIANAYLTATHGSSGSAITDAKLLFFRGCYVGGAHSLQAANGIDVIAEQAFAPSGVSDECLLEGAPYSKAALPELDALLESHVSNATVAGNGEAAAAAMMESAAAAAAEAALTSAEVECLRGVEARITTLQAAGVHIGGVVVEIVSAHSVHALRPAFLRGLRVLLTQHSLLLFEDAVMAGLRCGSAFLGAVCPAEARPDFVAIGKAFGFSGVLANASSTGHVAWRRPPRCLNGYLTMRMSAADLLRAVTIQNVVHERELMRNALQSGRRLRRCLRAQGLDVWGLGLLVGFDDGTTSGEDSSGGNEGCVEEDGSGGTRANEQAVHAQLLNASASFARMLPPLTLGERLGDWTYLSSCVVGSAEAAKRVAERVLWLNIEKREGNPMAMVDGEASSAAAIDSDYRPRLQEVLRAGVLQPYANILAPTLRAQLPRARFSDTHADGASAPESSAVPPGAGSIALSVSPEARLELVASLWADVLGM